MSLDALLCNIEGFIYNNKKILITVTSVTFSMKIKSLEIKKKSIFKIYDRTMGLHN